MKASLGYKKSITSLLKYKPHKSFFVSNGKHGKFERETDLNSL